MFVIRVVHASLLIYIPTRQCIKNMGANFLAVDRSQRGGRNNADGRTIFSSPATWFSRGIFFSVRDSDDDTSEDGIATLDPFKDARV